MAHWTKTFRRYERHMLLGLVILLLVIFSVTGALTRSTESALGGMKLGGVFEVPGGHRVEVSDADFEERYGLFRSYIGSVGRSTIDFAQLQRNEGMSQVQSTWIHIMLAEAARRVGMRCGEDQLRNAIKAALAANPRLGSLQVTPESYERFLTQVYQRPASDFERTLREVVLKDELLSTLVDPARFGPTYAEAYEEWKATGERVDLRYLATESASFLSEVTLEERSRRAMARPEDVLKRLGETLRRLKNVRLRLDEYKQAKNEWPAALKDLSAKESQSQRWSITEEQLKDAWSREFAYERGEAGVTVVSAGPDGAAGTADDVREDLQASLDSHVALAKVADALVRWRDGGEPKAWAATLEDLLKPPTRPAQPPGEPAAPRFAALNVLPKDGWGRELVYKPSADAPPTLLSAGADGSPGTADDIAAAISDTRGVVLPGPGIAPFVPADVVDAWNRPISVMQSAANTGTWVAHSAGPDGVPATADDLVGGNQADLEAFYTRSDVRIDFVEPARRKFRALVMHLPLIGDETLRRLWLDFPQFRPVSKEDSEMLFLRWTTARGTTPDYEFHVTDPRDPAKGHGAELAQRMWPGVAVNLVPAASVFEVPAAPGGEPAPGPAPAPTPAPTPEPAPEGNPTPDPLRAEYESKGWREILVRQEFLERVLNHFWQQVVESRRAARAWDQKGERITPRPTELKLEDLLAEERLGKYAPGEAERARGVRFLEMVEPAAALTTQEVGALKEFGDPALSVHLGQLRTGDVSSVPVQLNQRLTKALLESLEVKPERSPELAEVEEKVLERFLLKRSMDRAERELGAFQRDVQERTGARKPEDTDEGLWAAALASWREKHPGVAVYDERTGMFYGGKAPGNAKAPEGASAEERAALRRRTFVKQTGYGLVKPTDSKQDQTDASPGTFGRRAMRDDSSGENATGCAYVVQVAQREFPREGEFSPAEYAEFLTETVFGEARSTDPRLRRHATGILHGDINGMVAKYFENVAHLQAVFNLRTNSNLDQLGMQRR